MKRPDELPDVRSLRELEPPAGGLTRLRAAIEDDTQRRRTRVRWVFALAPVAVVIALVMWNRRGDQEQVDPAVHTFEPEAIADPQIAPTFYWVASTPGRAPEPPHASVTYIDVNATPPISQLP